MASRLDLQSKLEELLGSRNVYFQPPESVKMEYPAIKYSKSRVRKVPANDTSYLLHTSYELIVIDRKPDNPVIAELLKLPMCGYDRPYKADNLYHDVLTLYF